MIGACQIDERPIKTYTQEDVCMQERSVQTVLITYSLHACTIPDMHIEGHHCPKNPCTAENSPSA